MRGHEDHVVHRRRHDLFVGCQVTETAFDGATIDRALQFAVGRFQFGVARLELVTLALDGAKLPIDPVFHQFFQLLLVDLAALAGGDTGTEVFQFVEVEEHLVDVHIVAAQLCQPVLGLLVVVPLLAQRRLELGDIIRGLHALDAGQMPFAIFLGIEAFEARRDFFGGVVDQFKHCMLLK